jgi:4-deoxy-L-threo-5-hexosulose-uronate ketol-isomerase
MNCKVIYPLCQKAFKNADTNELRDNFLLGNLFGSGDISLVYWDVDRAVIGSAVPTGSELKLECPKELASDFFAQWREVGVFNIGAGGYVKADGQRFEIANREILYVGRGVKDISLGSIDKNVPAKFYLISFPAHTTYPTVKAGIEQASKVMLGDVAGANRRTINKYIHPDGIKSCQLVMGFTTLESGSVWNTMPPHTHARRSEIYLYFDIHQNGLVFHYMGAPQETRHLAVRSGQAVLSPSWSIHSGCGTGAYSFIWAMGGENQRFDDMDAVGISDIR